MKPYTAPDTEYMLMNNSCGMTYRVLYMNEHIGFIQKTGDTYVASPDRLNHHGAVPWGALMTQMVNVRSMLRTRHEAFLWLLGVRDGGRYSQ